MPRHGRAGVVLRGPLSGHRDGGSGRANGILDQRQAGVALLLLGVCRHDAARYGKFANVVGYEIFNEPHAGHLPDTTGTTNTILAWENQIYTSMHAVDPARTMFIMCRGGGEGVGTADLGQFGKGAKIALDFHDYVGTSAKNTSEEPATSGRRSASFHSQPPSPGRPGASGS